CIETECSLLLQGQAGIRRRRYRVPGDHACSPVVAHWGAASCDWRREHCSASRAPNLAGGDADGNTPIGPDVDLQAGLRCAIAPDGEIFSVGFLPARRSVRKRTTHL